MDEDLKGFITFTTGLIVIKLFILFGSIRTLSQSGNGAYLSGGGSQNS
jgi:hypothetical protein